MIIPRVILLARRYLQGVQEQDRHQRYKKHGYENSIAGRNIGKYIVTAIWKPRCLSISSVPVSKKPAVRQQLPYGVYL